MSDLPRAEDLIPDSWGAQQPSSLPRAEDLIPDQPRPWGDVAASAIKNIPASTINAGHGIFDAITSPIQTLQGLADVARGALFKAGVLDKTMPDRASSEAKFNALAQFYGDRYGSVEGFKNALATDPVGIVMDALGVASLGGGGLGALGEAANLPKVAAVGNALVDAGRFGDPMLYAGKAASALKVPEWLYGSALKPSTVMNADNRNAMIQSALNENIPMSIKGLDKTRDIISKNGQAVTDLVNDAAANGVNISAAAASAPVQNVLSKNIANPSDLNGARNVLSEFLDTYSPLHSIGVDSGIPVNTANEIKRGLNSELSKMLGRVDANLGYVGEAKDALRYGLRKEIENAVPEVAGYNQRMSPLLDLEPQLERALNRSANWNVVGLTAPTVASAVGSSVGSFIPGFFGGMATKALENPYVKTKLALALEQAGKGDYLTTGLPNYLASAYLADRMASDDR